MDEQASSASDPRWGEKGRDRKAEAILATLELHCRRDITRGIWLDVGCGSGGVAATLAAHVKQVVGVDPESWERWHSFDAVHSNLLFYSGSYRDLAGLFSGESIDVVVCNQVYEHVDDPLALLRALHQVMKPGGVCYFAGPNLLWPIEPHVSWPFVHWLPRRFAIRLMKLFRARYAKYLDAWSWTYWKLTRAFLDVGFSFKVALGERIQAEAVNGGPAFVRAIARIPRWLFSAAAPLAPGFIFVLTKPAPKA